MHKYKLVIYSERNYRHSLWFMGKPQHISRLSNFRIWFCLVKADGRENLDLIHQSSGSDWYRLEAVRDIRWGRYLALSPERCKAYPEKAHPSRLITKVFFLENLFFAGGTDGRIRRVGCTGLTLCQKRPLFFFLTYVEQYTHIYFTVYK